MHNTNIDCWLLDAMDDDFISIWELASILRQRLSTLSEAMIVTILTDRMAYLSDRKFILFYQGVTFQGDEEIIKIDIIEGFILSQITPPYPVNHYYLHTKVYITDLGRQFYISECNYKMFD